MEIGVYNASIQYEDRIYNNMSGVIAGQSNGKSGDRMVYEDEENYVIKHFESSEVSAEQRFGQSYARPSNNDYPNVFCF